MISEKRYFVSEEIRPLSQRSDIMGFALVLHCYSLITIPLVFFSLWPNYFTFFLAIIVIGSRQLGLAILMHDAAHRALFEKKFLNEKIGFWLCGNPILADLFTYRHYHLMHHKHTQTEDDPDRVLSQPFPISRRSLWRKFLRDFTGQTGVKNISKQVLNSFKLAFDQDAIDNSVEQAQSFKAKSLFKPLISNVIIFLFMWCFGAWWWWLAFWLLPLITWFQVVVRIRNIAEHAATEFTTDELQNVRTTHANLLMRVLVAPYWVNYHLEHHLIMHVPCWRLPQIHKLMVQKGYREKMKLARNYIEVLREITKKGHVSNLNKLH